MLGGKLVDVPEVKRVRALLEPAGTGIALPALVK